MRLYFSLGPFYEAAMAVAVGETPAAVEDHDQARKEYTMTGGPDGQPPRHRLAPGRIRNYLKMGLV